MMEIDYRKESRIMQIVAASISPDAKISKLTIMALKAFPGSPVQKAIQKAREDIRTINT